MKKLPFFALLCLATLASAANLTNITGIGNMSVIDHTAQYFGGLETVFGNPTLFGAMWILFFAGLLLLLRVSLDVALIVGIPLMLMLGAYGWMPWAVTFVVYIGVGIVVTIAILNLTRR